MVTICKRCQSRIATEYGNSSFYHICTAEFSPALRDEDIQVRGNWTDYTGSGTEPPQTTMARGLQDKQWGTRPWIEGASNLPDYTIRGKSKSTYRTRQHLEEVQIIKSEIQKI